MQITGSKIIQTDNKSFPKQRTHFLSYILDLLMKIYQTLKKYFLRIKSGILRTHELREQPITEERKEDPVPKDPK